MYLPRVARIAMISVCNADSLARLPHLFPAFVRWSSGALFSCSVGASFSPPPLMSSPRPNLITINI